MATSGSEKVIGAVSACQRDFHAALLIRFQLTNDTAAIKLVG